MGPQWCRLTVVAPAVVVATAIAAGIAACALLFHQLAFVALHEVPWLVGFWWLACPSVRM
jgi:hypothetical protein